MGYAFQLYYSPYCQTFIDIISNTFTENRGFLTLTLLVFSCSLTLKSTSTSASTFIVFSTNNKLFKQLIQAYLAIKG